MLRRWLCVMGMAGVLAVIPACAKKPPTVVSEPPAPLEVPVPPPRILAPVPPPDTPPPPVEEPPADPPRPARPRVPARPASSPEPKAEPTRAEGPPADAATPQAEKAGESAPALRTPQTVNDTEAERRITDVLTRTRRSLGNVSRAQLSADARAQFDTARRFIDQAADALKVRNYMFAAYLADKAETLAKGLAGR